MNVEIPFFPDSDTNNVIINFSFYSGNNEPMDPLVVGNSIYVFTYNYLCSDVTKAFNVSRYQDHSKIKNFNLRNIGSEIMQSQLFRSDVLF